MSYLAVMAALIGVCLLAGTAYLARTTGRSDQQPPRTGAVVVSASVQQPTWAPIPNVTDAPTAAPRPTPERVPPDPGTGPIPLCSAPSGLVPCPGRRWPTPTH